MYCCNCGAKFQESLKDREVIWSALEVIRDRLRALGVPMRSTLERTNPLPLFGAYIDCCEEPQYLWRADPEKEKL